ncbi:arginine methyl transferase [Laccaria bicolor S238N-H82]|uniref:Arginine N-methyltransferase 2 n=1 Tax=Laccaria bicolor (strain S238N-H82 / ATCC MYA-4686) TaxID=486041 RepID=B0E0Y4_LACBS|nr:arginine methyl transferase [Laccaria bicolor S238N-H82]EDQ99484.1 arginine methyl transferase [Laccaria bicolor S238N-H82]|eukprot:XP_001889833.1 arginine methyl transferase [Laccaria bicolor S238N-H82]
MDQVDAATVLGEHLINAILENASVETVKDILKSGAPVWYQNEEEGVSPLHAAAYVQNEELVAILIERGAVWNAVDNFKNTAGDIALSFNNAGVYTRIRDAGIRAEMLLGILNTRSDSDESMDAEDGALILREKDTTATGSNTVFLESKLRYTVDEHGQEICMLKVGGEEVGVMMGWEKDIMQETVKKLCDDHPNNERLKVLNVGFGLGIIDTLFQSLPHPPTQHIIIEPHPDVLQHMRDLGWYDKLGVQILEGKWQDFINADGNESVLLDGGGFDVIYTDTFSEDYSDLHRFFEHLPDLLAGPESRFSFFNGLGATNALFYDVYTHIAELHLAEVGFDVEWSDVDVTSTFEEDRWGKSREYFTLPFYRLPIAKMGIMI